MYEHDDWLAQRFEENRTHLRAVAYRMLGSHSEADDAVQEAWLRLSRSDTSGIENLGGWLTTVVGRVCLNMLRSRRSRHSKPWLPPSGSRSCCTTCSPCPSKRSPPSWGAPRPRRGSSRAAHAAGCRERPLLPTPVLPASEKLSTPSSLPRARVTSRRCSRCSTRTSCCESMAVPCVRAYRGRSAACGR